MILSLDASVLAGASLADEAGHAKTLGLLNDPELTSITGTWTRIEVSGRLVRAAQQGRGRAGDRLALLDADLGPHGPVAVVSASQNRVEEVALGLVRAHGLRPMDALRLIVAALTLFRLAEPGKGGRVGAP